MTGYRGGSTGETISVLGVQSRGHERLKRLGDNAKLGEHLSRKVNTPTGSTNARSGGKKHGGVQAAAGKISGKGNKSRKRRTSGGRRK